MNAEILVPVLAGCALLWWVGRGLTWSARLMVAAATLVLVIAVLFFERGSGLR